MCVYENEFNYRVICGRESELLSFLCFWMGDKAKEEGEEREGVVLLVRSAWQWVFDECLPLVPKIPSSRYLLSRKVCSLSLPPR